MSTLLLRLAAPLQSWGVDAKFDRRGTQRTPTKSGVIGLVAGAMGRTRDEDLTDLNALRFGVRVDNEGILLRDYHTAKSEKSTYVTNRYYLSDAVFLVGLEGEDIFLAQIEYALFHPVFPLFLGRRSCPVEGRLSLGIRTGKTIEDALREEPWLVSEWISARKASQVRLRIEWDADKKDSDVLLQRDLPLSFDQSHRKFGFRRVISPRTITVLNKSSLQTVIGSPTQHDPMTELGGEVTDVSIPNRA